MRPSLPNIDELVANIHRQASVEQQKVAMEKRAAVESSMTDVGRLLRKLAEELRNSDDGRVTLDDVLDFTSRFGRG
jgi:hypothetical protein